MANFVPAHEQLVVELYVRDLEVSKAFYTNLGFRLVREELGFAVMGWEQSELLLEEVEDQPEPLQRPPANIRIMVPDVDAYWERVIASDILVHHRIADRDYGLRDFTIVSPDGVGLRFASPRLTG